MTDGMYYTMSYSKLGKGTSGYREGNRYVLESGCQTCGCGCPLLGELIVSGLKKNPGAVFMTKSGDYLVNHATMMRLNDESALNVPLQEAVLRGNQTSETKYYHLNPIKILPPFNAEESQGYVLEGQCQTCKRDGHFTKFRDYQNQITLSYRRDDFDSGDFFGTFERIGNSSISTENGKTIYIARPILIVSKDFKQSIETVSKDLLFTRIDIK